MERILIYDEKKKDVSIVQQLQLTLHNAIINHRRTLASRIYSHIVVCNDDKKDEYEHHIPPYLRSEFSIRKAVVTS